MEEINYDDLSQDDFLSLQKVELKIPQVDGATGDIELEMEDSGRRDQLDYFKSILSKLLRDDYDKFEILNICVKLNVDVSCEPIFSKQKYLLQKCVLEQIIKEDSDEYFKRLLDEAIEFLNYKKDPGFQCCLVGCVYRSARHRNYIKHMKDVHLNYDNYLCQFMHHCQRRFSSISLLIEHIRLFHTTTAAKVPKDINKSDFEVACKCDLQSCRGQHFANLQLFLAHFNNDHVKEVRHCVFENCSQKFKENSVSRHHFRLKHFNLKKIKLKKKHLVQPDLPLTVADFDDEFNVNPAEVEREILVESYYDDLDHIFMDTPVNVEEDDVDEIDEVDHFLKAYADFLNRMCSYKFVPYNTMQTIASEYLEHSLKSMKHRETLLRKSLKDVPNITEEKITEIVETVLHEDKFLKAQRDLDTDYKRRRFVKENFKYVSPIEYVLNKNEVSVGKPNDVFHYVPVVQSFKLLVEDQTFIVMMDKEREKEKLDKDVLKDIKDGSVYKNVPFFKDNPNALVGIFYSDAVELVNPLGSGKGKHKIVQVFWTLGDIPRQQRSQIDRIQVALVVKEKVLKKHGYKLVYKHLLSDLKVLEQGVNVKAPVPRLMKLGILVHSGDNLESHSVGGFSTCFSSRDICCFCHAQYGDIVDHIHDYDGDTAHSYWTREEYDGIVDELEREEDLEETESEIDEITTEELEENLFNQIDEPNDSEGSECDSVSSDAIEDDDEDVENDGSKSRYGLREKCPFNELQAFHATYGFPPDALHDLFEGVVAQDLCGCIKILSDKGWFNLEEYNGSLRKQTYKSYERNDKPQEIKNMKAVKLPGKAVSLWTHMRNFGFIVKPFVKDTNDEVLALVIKLADIVERLTAVEFRLYEIEILEDLILEYLDNRKLILEEYSNLLGRAKPKHHFLYHYPEAIRKFGPPLSFWTGRFESKHRQGV